MFIGSGITIQSGITITPSISGNIVTNGLTMYLDPAVSASYPGSGTTWYDISGQGNNVTLVNNPTYSTNYFTFDGASQYGIGSGTPLAVNQYSKCFWVNLANYGFNNNTLSSFPGGHFTYFSGTNQLYNGHSDWSNYQTYASTATFNLNTWYHVCLTFDTTNGMTLYINGVFDSSYNGILTGLPGTGECDIAEYDNGGNLLCGSIGQALCYNRAITSSEVTQNFNATRARYGI